jgi:hypothetical protein
MRKKIETYLKFELIFIINLNYLTESQINAFISLIKFKNMKKFYAYKKLLEYEAYPFFKPSIASSAVL